MAATDRSNFTAGAIATAERGDLADIAERLADEIRWHGEDADTNAVFAEYDELPTATMRRLLASARWAEAERTEREKTDYAAFVEEERLADDVVAAPTISDNVVALPTVWCWDCDGHHPAGACALTADEVSTRKAEKQRIQAERNAEAEQERVVRTRLTRDNKRRAVVEATRLRVDRPDIASDALMLTLTLAGIMSEWDGVDDRDGATADDLAKQAVDHVLARAEADGNRASRKGKPPAWSVFYHDAMAWFDGADCPLTANDRAVLLALIDFYNVKTEDSRPGEHRLARRTGLDRKTVNRRIKAMTSAGYIQAEPQGFRRASRYTFHLPIV